MENNVICPLPFMKIYNNLDASTYTPCCWSNHWYDKENNITNTLPLEHFTGEVFNRIRKEMLVGKKTEFLKEYCNTCWAREENFGHSPRLEFKDFIETLPLIPGIYFNKGTSDNIGSKIINDYYNIKIIMKNLLIMK